MFHVKQGVFMSWENDNMNIFNNRTIEREKFFIEKECESEDEECQIVKEITPTHSESLTTLSESTTPTKD